MKRFPAVILVFFFKLSFSQGYYALPDSNSVWSVDTIKYTVKGDSVFNSLTYKKYYFSSDSTLALPSLKYVGLVRQDIAHKRAFGIQKNQSAEHLLYDFSLNVSDTVTVYAMDFPLSTGPFTMQVLAKDSVLLNGLYRKRLEFKGNIQTEYWIEGIGSSWGPLNPGLAYYNLVDICFPTLLCQNQNGVLVYKNMQYNSCRVACPLGIMEYQKASQVSILPNPNQGLFIVHTPQGVPCFIEIYNRLGGRVYWQKLGTNRTEVDLITQPKGIYFYRVLSENKFLGSGKLVIE